MKTNRLNVFLVALLIALSGFLPPVFAATIPAAQPDKGLVVFYRPSRAKGAAIRFEIFEDSKGSIGVLSNGTIIQTDLEPGDYTFSVRSPSVDGRDVITVKVEANKVYYIKGEILWGWPAGRPKFTRVSDTDAQADLANMK